MNKIILSFALAAGLFMSCSSNDIDTTQPDEGNRTTFVAEGNAITRNNYILNHAVGGGAQPCWQPGDKLWIYINPTWRIGSLGNNATDVTQRAKFYFQAGLNEPSYRLHYLGHSSTTDGIHVPFPAQQWNILHNSTHHLQFTGDCAEATATRNPNKAGIYTMKFTRLPAYLYIIPYCSELFRANYSVVKRIIVRSNQLISGSFDVAQHGFDATYASSTGNSLDCYFAGTETATYLYLTPNPTQTSMYVAIPPGYHNLTIEVYYTSPNLGEQMTSRTVGPRWYYTNTMTDLLIDVAEHLGGYHENINAGATIATAKKTRGVEAVVDTTWNGTFDR